MIFVTGLGKATPGGDPGAEPLETGSLAPLDGNPLFRTVDTPVVKVGDIPAEVQFSGLTPGFAGLYQINIVVPAGAPGGDEVPIVVSMPNGLGRFPHDCNRALIRRRTLPAVVLCP